jgi:hypothetical protein
MDFRPISLCNVIYKVVSKCLANRLRPFLQGIIAPEQSAFVPGRLITDNALAAFECIHSIQSGSVARSNFCAYNLDMAKAYDRVDWRFLEGVLAKMGFHRQWIQWVMTCVTTISYSVRFNGNMLDSFFPTRGLRQGDPLSPYLFLFVADGFSSLMKKHIQSGTCGSYIYVGVPQGSLISFSQTIASFSFKGRCNKLIPSKLSWMIINEG